MNYPPTYEDVHGKGLGDPDTYGYPGESEKLKHKTPEVYRNKHWSEIVRNPNNTYGPREYGDNAAEAPEQNWEED